MGINQNSLIDNLEEGNNKGHTLGKAESERILFAKVKVAWFDFVVKLCDTGAKALFEVSYHNQLIKLMMWNVSVLRRWGVNKRQQDN